MGVPPNHHPFQQDETIHFGVPQIQETSIFHSILPTLEFQTENPSRSNSVFALHGGRCLLKLPQLVHSRFGEPGSYYSMLVYIIYHLYCFIYIYIILLYYIIILYYIILYCIILYCIIIYYILLYHIILYCIILF